MLSCMVHEAGEGEPDERLDEEKECCEDEPWFSGVVAVWGGAEPNCLGVR